jgi:hypothetical protein
MIKIITVILMLLSLDVLAITSDEIKLLREYKSNDKVITINSDTKTRADLNNFLERLNIMGIKAHVINSNKSTAISKIIKSNNAMEL